MLQQEPGLFWTQMGRSDFCFKILRHREASEKWWCGNRNNIPTQPLLGDFSLVLSCRFVFLFVLRVVSSWVQWAGRVCEPQPVGSAARAAHRGAVTHPGMAGLSERGGTSCSSPAVRKMWGGWGCSGLWQWTPSYVLLVFLRALISPYVHSSMGFRHPLIQH